MGRTKVHRELCSIQTEPITLLQSVYCLYSMAIDSNFHE